MKDKDNNGDKDFLARTKTKRKGDLLKTGTVGRDFLRLMLLGEPWLDRGQCPATYDHNYEGGDSTTRRTCVPCNQEKLSPDRADV